jgi:hypothetical protein
MKILNLVVTLTAISLSNVQAAEIQHFFSSPSFSGIGYSSHILTIKQLEDQQKDKNTAKAEALQAQAKADALNTPQAKFTANLESRVYAQLAKQLTDSLFGTGGAPTCTAATAGSVCGSIPDLAGNSIAWKLGTGSDKGMIIIEIANLSNPSQKTTMKVPAGTFAF